MLGGIASDFTSQLLNGQSPDLGNIISNYFSDPGRVARDFLVGGVFGTAFGLNATLTQGHTLARAVGTGAVNATQGWTGRKLSGDETGAADPANALFDFVLGFGISATFDTGTKAISNARNPKWQTNPVNLQPRPQISSFLSKNRDAATSLIESGAVYAFLTTLGGTNIVGPFIPVIPKLLEGEYNRR